MRFQQYIVDRLDEKVTQQEIDNALKNDKVLIGVELEFLVDKVREYKDDSLYHEYDDAYSAWDAFNLDFRDFERDRDRLWKAKEDTDEKIEELEEKVNELQDEIDDLEDDRENNYQKINSLKSKLDNYRGRIEEFKEKSEELETDYEEIEYPYPSSEYVDYMKLMYDEYGVGDRWRIIEDMIYDGNIPEPPHPQETSAAIDDQNVWNTVVMSLEDLWDTLPVDNYVINGSDQSPGDNYWNIKYDSSIAAEGGIELVSSPMKIDEFMRVVPELFKWIDKNGDTSSSCGLHIHMGIEGVRDLEGELDPIKMVLFVDEDYIWKYFDSRKFNTYTRSMKSAIIGRGINTEDFTDLIDKKMLKKGMKEDHYDAINFESWKSGHIEFRHMGGSKYHKKWKEVSTIVARNVHALVVGLDPDYKREEYITKLSRQADKLEAIKYNKVIEWYNEFIPNFKGHLNVMKKTKDVEYDFFIKYLERERDNVNKILQLFSKFDITSVEYRLQHNKIFVETCEQFAKKYLHDSIEKFVKQVRKDFTFDDDDVKFSKAWVDISDLVKK